MNLKFGSYMTRVTNFVLQAYAILSYNCLAATRRVIKPWCGHRPAVRPPHNAVRSPNHRCSYRTGLCAHRTGSTTTSQCSALTEPPVRLSNRPVRSPNRRCDHRTILCGNRTGGAVTDRHCDHLTMQCAHRTTGAVIEQACADIKPAVRPPHNAVRSLNHRCSYRTGLSACLCITTNTYLLLMKVFISRHKTS